MFESSPGPKVVTTAPAPLMRLVGSIFEPIQVHIDLPVTICSIAYLIISDWNPWTVMSQPSRLEQEDTRLQSARLDYRAM
jgi:hypothetical protein